MKIIVYGTGCCSNCEILYQNTKKAAAELGIDAEIRKETDIEKIMSQNIMSLPAISADGKIAAQGRKLSVEDIKKILEGAK